MMSEVFANISQLGATPLGVSLVIAFIEPSALWIALWSFVWMVFWFVMFKLALGKELDERFGK